MDNLSEMLKGVLPGIVLEIIAQEKVYGYQIVRKLDEIGFIGMSEGTVYTILLRLERDRLVTITKQPSRLGPPRKFYTLNRRGEEELTAFWKRWSFLAGCITGLKEKGEDLNGKK